VRQSAIFTLCGEAVILFLVIGRRGGRLAGEAMRYFHYWLAILLMGVALPAAIAKEADASGAIISATQPIDVFYFSDRQPVAGENGAIHMAPIAPGLWLLVRWRFSRNRARSLPRGRQKKSSASRKRHTRSRK
jgi:hypothetical protein